MNQSTPKLPDYEVALLEHFITVLSYAEAVDDYRLNIAIGMEPEGAFYSVLRLHHLV